MYSEGAITAEDLERIAAGYSSTPQQSWSLHKDVYVDRPFFELDQQAIKQSWQFACHIEKLRKPGDYVTLDIQGQPIFAIRDTEGQLRAFYNVCLHRAHELLTGDGSKKAITCPYHAWTYRLDGSLAAARRSEQVQDFEAEDFCLTSVSVEVFCSLVFVNLNPDASPLVEQTQTLSDEITSFAPDLGALTHAKRLTYDIKANWKAVVDNFLECYHCEIAHRDFVSMVEMDTYEVTTHGIWSSHHAKAGRSENSAYSVADASVTDHAVWWLWPNTALLRYPGRGNFMVWQFMADGPDRTHEIFDFYFETADLTQAETEALEYINDVLQVEDIGLVESVQRGMNTPGFQRGRFMTDAALDGGAGSGLSEHAVHHFHGLLLKNYRELVKRETV